MGRLQVALGDAMALSSRTRISLVALLSFLVVAVVLLVVNQRGVGEVTSAESSVSGEEVATEPEGDEDSTEEVTEESLKPVTGEPAKRIMHVPDNDRKEFQRPMDWSAIQITLEYLPLLAELAVNDAVAGDIDAAYQLRRIREICSFAPKDEAAIEKELARTQERVERRRSTGDAVPDEGEPSGFDLTTYPDEKRNRNEIRRLYRSCSSVRAVFSQDLRKQLNEKAQTGDVMARYIYAIWEPDWILSDSVFETYREWQLNALDFSYSNLEEGEPLGLLALGRSYELGLFTRQFPAIGFSLTKAAFDCGLDSRIVEKYVSRLANSDSAHFIDGASVEEAVRLSSQLVTYCQ